MFLYTICIQKSEQNFGFVCFSQTGVKHLISWTVVGWLIESAERGQESPRAGSNPRASPVISGPYYMNYQLLTNQNAYGVKTKFQSSFKIYFTHVRKYHYFWSF